MCKLSVLPSPKNCMISVLYIFALLFIETDCYKNIAVFDPSRVKIVKIEEIEIEWNKSIEKWTLKDRKEV